MQQLEIHYHVTMPITYKTIEEIRRENLRLIVARYASVAAAAKALERSEPQINNVLSGRENIGSKLARSLEKLAGEPAGWMDTQPPDAEALRKAVMQVLELSKTVANPDNGLLAEQAVDIYESELGNTPMDMPTLLRKYTGLAKRMIKR